LIINLVTRGVDGHILVMTTCFNLSPMAIRCRLLFFTVLSFSIVTTEAQLIPIYPFGGVTVETFESFSPGSTVAPITIMGGAATVQTSSSIGICSPLNHAFSLGNSSQNAIGFCAVPTDGTNILGVESGLGHAAMDIVFTNTVKAFGGYWGAAADSTPATISFIFLDSADQQIGATQSVSYIRFSGDGVIEWHGWFSTTPFKKVRVSASGSTLVGDSFRAGAAGFSIITSISPLGANQFVLLGNGTTGVVFNVQANTNLATTNWVTVGTAPANASGVVQFTNSSVLPQRFYRLQGP
jgi:hypothetical protein